jgi:hypothetical protein
VTFFESYEIDGAEPVADKVAIEAAFQLGAYHLATPLSSHTH